MTLVQLQYIVALDTHRHFVTAAEKCFVTQPTLTMQVKKLEEELGVKIFDRSRSPLHPTPIGEKILQKAREVLMQAGEIEEMVQSEDERISGKFKLGIIPTLAPYLLPRFIKNFTRRYPNTKLITREMQSSEIIAALQNNDLDLGLMVTPLSLEGIRETPLFYEPFHLYVSPEHKLFAKHEVDASDLDEDGLWLLNEGHCFRSQVLNICNSSINERSFVYESGSIETLKKLVEGHEGYTLVPHLGINPKGDQLKYYRDFKSPIPTREVSIVSNSHALVGGIIQAIKKEILESLPPEIRKAPKDHQPIAVYPKSYW